MCQSGDNRPVRYKLNQPDNPMQESKDLATQQLDKRACHRTSRSGAEVQNQLSAPQSYQD